MGKRVEMGDDEHQELDPDKIVVVRRDDTAMVIAKRRSKQPMMSG